MKSDFHITHSQTNTGLNNFLAGFHDKHFVDRIELSAILTVSTSLIKKREKLCDSSANPYMHLSIWAPNF